MKISIEDNKEEGKSIEGGRGKKIRFYIFQIKTFCWTVRFDYKSIKSPW